jgi:iron complex outermembrane receptor protein
MAASAVSWSAEAGDAAPPASGPPSLEEVTVTATRRSESSQRVPISIAVLSEHDLQSKGIQTSMDLQQSTPGLIFNSNANFAQPYIRGIGTDITTPGAESSVSTYIDDIYQSQPYMGVQVLSDVERIEVLKGPQGTLYGRNATGGTIAIHTHDPSPTFTGSAQIDGGNYGLFSFKGSVSGPLTEQIAGNLAVSTSKRDGYGRNLTDNSDYNSEDYQLVRGKLKYDPTDTLSLLFTAHYYHRDDDGGQGYTYLDNFGTTPVPAVLGGKVTIRSQDVYAAFPMSNKVDAQGASLRATWTPAAVKVTYISSYSKMAALIGPDFAGTDIPIFTFRADRDRAHTLVQELFADGAVGSLNWLAGASYFQDASRFDPILIFGPALPVNSSEYSQIDTQAYAGYTELRYALTDRWALTAGARASHEKKSHSRYDIFATGTDTLLATGPDVSQSSTQPTFKGVVERSFDQALLYAKVETGFKSGTFNAQVPNDYVPAEKVTSYELGAKSQTDDHRLRANASAFYYDYTNLQSQYLGASGATFLESAPKARIYGAEIDLDALVLDGLKLTSGLTYLHSRYVDFVSKGALIPGPGGIGNAAFAGFNADGKDLTRSPQFTANVGFDWIVPLKFAQLETSGQYFHSSSYKLDVTNRVQQGAYDVVNAQMRLLFGTNWSVGIWGRNLTNEKYLQSISISSLGDEAQLAAPRTYGGSIRFTF